jgi:hypothetical protein
MRSFETTEQGANRRSRWHCEQTSKDAALSRPTQSDANKVKEGRTPDHRFEYRDQGHSDVRPAKASSTPGTGWITRTGPKTSSQTTLDRQG